jgi:hypothetical protein
VVGVVDAEEAGFRVVVGAWDVLQYPAANEPYVQLACLDPSVVAAPLFARFDRVRRGARPRATLGRR